MNLTLDQLPDLWLHCASLYTNLSIDTHGLLKMRHRFLRTACSVKQVSQVIMQRRFWDRSGFGPGPGYVQGGGVPVPGCPGCWRGCPVYYEPAPARVHRERLPLSPVLAVPVRATCRSDPGGGQSSSSWHRPWRVLLPALYRQAHEALPRNGFLPVPIVCGAHIWCPAYILSCPELLHLPELLPFRSFSALLRTLLAACANRRWPREARQSLDVPVPTPGASEPELLC